MILLNGVTFRTRMKIGKSAAATAAVLYFRVPTEAASRTAQAAATATNGLARACAEVS